jgi:hypothetical protein
MQLRRDGRRLPRAVRKPQPVLNRMSPTRIVLDKDINALNRTADVETEN